jgi:hypothetical protein
VRAVERKKLQLVGVTALLVASKLKDTPPTVERCCWITDQTFTEDEVLC